MVRIILVRHSITDWNAKGLVQGRSDIPLSDVGRELAASQSGIFAGVNISAIYSSPLIRAVETARLMLGEPKTDKRLLEREFGDYDGTHYAALDRKTRAKLFYGLNDISGIEQSEQIFTRVQDFLADMKENHDGETVAVFSHAVCLSYLIYATKHKQFSSDDYEVAYIENCSSMVVEI